MIFGNLKIGERLAATKDHMVGKTIPIKRGMVCRILDIDACLSCRGSDTRYFAVEFDLYLGTYGHSCTGLGKYGHCLYLTVNELRSNYALAINDHLTFDEIFGQIKYHHDMSSLIASRDEVKTVSSDDGIKVYVKSKTALDDAFKLCTRIESRPPYAISKVIFNDPATIVFWKDGSKTVVKAENEPFDKEKGLAMAISKKALGNKGNYYNIFKDYIK